MNVHNCIRCGNPINYDDTDWCEVCDMSIFDERMSDTKRGFTIKNKSNIYNKSFFVHNDIYRIEGIYEYPNFYQIHTRCDASDTTKPDRVFQLSKELNFADESKHRYKIVDEDSKYTLWVKRESIETENEMIELLKSLIGK